MNDMAPFEIRARPTARSIRTVLVGPVVLAIVGVGLVVGTALAGALASDTRVLLSGLGALLVLVGVPTAWQQRRRLWPGTLVRLDADGVHARRDRSFVDLGWDQVAGVRLLSTALQFPGRPDRDAVCLVWVPLDDRAVPAGPANPMERVFPLSPARARMATLFNGRDRSDELRALLDVVRRHQPHVDVLDAALGTEPDPDGATGDEVMVLANGSEWGLVPDLLRGIREAGSSPVLLSVGPAGPTGHRERLARALGAGVRQVDVPAGPVPREALEAALAPSAALVMVGSEPGQAHVASEFRLSVSDLRAVLSHRPTVVVTPDPADVDAYAGWWEDDAVVVCVEALTHTEPVGAITLSGQRPSAVEPLAVSDLAAAVAALLVRPAGQVVAGVVHASGGTTPIADAVAGCAG